MKRTYLILIMAACAAAAIAQTSTTPAPTTAPVATAAQTSAPAAAPAVKTTATAAKPAETKPEPPKPPADEDEEGNPIYHPEAPALVADIHCNALDKPCTIKLPKDIPPTDAKLVDDFSLRYQDIKIGTGDVAEPGKEYIFHYTGWIAADGKQFDTSYNHRGKIMDKDQKPVKDANGKDELGPPQPLTITQGAQGIEHALTGLDQGFEGMRVGGKRRIIIPYQLAYGTRERPSPGPDLPVGIPPKSDLIFDVELLAVNDPPEKHKHSMGAPPHPPATPRAPAKPTQPAPSAPAAAAPANTAQPK